VADERYQVHTLTAAGALALGCLALCGFAIAGYAVPSWLAWLATACTNAVVALEKGLLLKRGKP
jgi:hypothetical protein